MMDWLKGGAPEPRKGMPSPRLSEDEFKRRFLQQYQDPAFDAAARASSSAWRTPRGTPTRNSRKSPRTRKAGPEFADPDYDLAVDWLAARAARSTRRSAATRTSPGRSTSC